jgi:hypothetical protein
MTCGPACVRGSSWVGAVYGVAGAVGGEIITCWEPWETGGTSAEPYAGFNNFLVPLRLFES